MLVIILNNIKYLNNTVILPLTRIFKKKYHLFYYCLLFRYEKI